MKLSANLKAKRAELVKAAGAILATAQAAKREMSEQEEKDFDAMHAEASAMDAKITRAELQEKREAELTALEPAIVTEAHDDVPAALPRAPITDAMSIEEFMRPPARQPVIWGRIKNCASIKEAYRFGAWAGAFILKAPWAIKLASKMFSPQAVNNEGTNTQGGYLVPEEFLNTMISLVEKQGVFRRKSTLVPMTRDRIVMPRDTAGLTAYPVGESAAGTESTATWDQISLVPTKWMVLTRMTTEVDEDSVVSIGDWLMGKIALAFATAEDSAGFNGDGTSTYAGIVGLKNALGASCKVTQGTSNTWAAQVLADINSLQSKQPDFIQGMQNEFYANKAYYHNVLARLAFAGGGNTAVIIRDGIAEGQFFGAPVNFVSALPKVTATTGIMAYYGDLGAATKFGDRRKIEISTSMEASVGGQSMWERDQIGIKGTERFDIVVHERGTTTAADAGGPINAIITG